MKWKSISKAVVIPSIVGLAIFLLNGCIYPVRDNPYDPKSDDYRIGIVSQDPENETVITGDQTITIRFSDSMDTGSLILDGDLSGASTVWSKTVETNDTLTLSPPGSIWPSEGDDKSISIVCNSVNGISTGTIVQSFDVFYGVFVSIAGDDADPGSISEPKRNVQAGIDKADGLYTSAQVRVAEGTYTSDYDSTSDPVADMAEGISLYGGYSANFSNRDPDVYTTILQDTSASGGNDLNPNRAVNIGSGVSSSTVISGFVIKSGGTASYNSSLVNDGSPIITGNAIQGLPSGYAGYTYGIYSTGGSPLIEKNEFYNIYAGSESICLKLEGSTASVRNNIIRPGSAVIYTYGIWDRINSDSYIYNNIIDCGKGTSGGYGLFLEDSNPVVVNNIFTNLQDNSTVYAIYEWTAAADPAEVRNNDFFNVYLSNTMYHDADGDGDFSSVAAMETDLGSEGITASGNLNNTNPQFSSPPSDYSLTSSSPASISSGGIDGGPGGENWGFSDDLNGISRTGDGTAGWSMGPYEYD